MIKQLIEKGDFYHCYQPIYDLNNWKIIGYEALLRTNHDLETIEIFEQAEQIQLLNRLATSSFTRAAHTYSKSSNHEVYLFINIHPSTLTTKDFIEEITKLSTLSLKIVCEINETEQIENFSEFTNALDQLRRSGVLISLDNIGIGALDIKKLIECKAHFIKIDKFFLEGEHFDEKKYLFLNLLKHYCHIQGIKLIIEGISSPKRLALTKAWGIDYGQGYILGRPQHLNEPVRV
ncbi:EAL domain-containing protein [Halalkalibacillus sediminis]|uniref:EAL domain-containing protein n=1 Tax=Halalkalibacillus sediminis TaxID=2018042 RepID=UPI00139042F0|nr:EAL domain-containing protein [Halalkalibacillus sediminis]